MNKMNDGQKSRLEFDEKNCSGFSVELELLINKYSQENMSNTRDYMLAQYVSQCLPVLNNAIISINKMNEPNSHPRWGRREI